NIPLSNIYYYSDECVIASKLEIYSNVSNDRIIGLASVYEDITSKEVELSYLNSNKFIISTVGRFVDFKIGYLLAIINYVKTKKDLVLYVVGYGPKEELIKNAAGSADNIFLLGRLGIESTKYVVENSDLYVGMGTTLVDAVSVGTPAIVAIESSNQAITTGYFGKSGGISFGEFNIGTKYFSLIEFVDKAVLNKNNIYCQQSKPWLKLISSHERISKINIIYVLALVIFIPIVSLVRKFEAKDYH
ncbi:MAG: glycosyltransferase family 4 protein, partial [Shewanella sp.]